MPDSRSYGPVSADMLIGRITWKFSFKRFQFERLSTEAPAPDYVVTSLADLHEDPFFRRVAGLPIQNSKNEAANNKFLSASSEARDASSQNDSKPDLSVSSAAEQ